MRKCWFQCTVLGGLIVFVWGIISWLVLPWHSYSVERFNDEAQVASVILNNAPTNGIYVLPNVYGNKIAGTTQEVNQELVISDEIMHNGPHMFAAIRLQGKNPYSYGAGYFRALLFNFAAAFVITWLLLKTKNQDYMDRVWFVTAIGVVGGILFFLPSWNFMCFPIGYAVVGILDFAIGWFLAGLAIAKYCVHNGSKRN